MDAGKLRDKITIEKRTIETDEVGNQSSKWVVVYRGFASVNKLYGREYWAAAASQSEDTVVFSLRYHPIFNTVNSLDYRLLFRGDEYDIKSVDNVKHINDTVKIRATVKG